MILSSFYLACQDNDLRSVRSCLKKIKAKEIDYQFPPNGETVLHVATRNQHREIIQILLQYGAQPTLRNKQGKQAFQLAETEEIKELFNGMKSSRFTFSNAYSGTSTLAKRLINCKNCSLVTNNTMYEWEVVDQNAAQTALQFRCEFQAYSRMNAKIWKKKLYSLNKGYLTAHLQDFPTVERAIIHDCFKRALLEENPNHLVTAFTSFQNFSKCLNIDMARNVMHNLKNGCSQFSCQCLYLTGGGTKIISNLFLHHPNFENLGFQGEVYRGIVMSKSQLDHYKEGSCIITTTFLSTSKDPTIAEVCADKCGLNASTHSFFCTYKIITNSHIAIDISGLSQHHEEEEVLILPYSPFLITKIEEKEERTNIYLEEQCLANIKPIRMNPTSIQTSRTDMKS